MFCFLNCKVRYDLGVAALAGAVLKFSREHEPRGAELVIKEIAWVFKVLGITLHAKYSFKVTQFLSQ